MWLRNVSKLALVSTKRYEQVICEFIVNPSYFFINVLFMSKLCIIFLLPFF